MLRQMRLQLLNPRRQRHDLHGRTSRIPLPQLKKLHPPLLLTRHHLLLIPVPQIQKPLDPIRYVQSLELKTERFGLFALLDFGLHFLRGGDVKGGGFGVALLAGEGVDDRGVFGYVFGGEGFGGEAEGDAALAFEDFGATSFFGFGHFGAGLLLLMVLLVVNRSIILEEWQRGRSNGSGGEEGRCGEEGREVQGG